MGPAFAPSSQMHESACSTTLPLAAVTVTVVSSLELAAGHILTRGRNSLNSVGKGGMGNGLSRLPSRKFPAFNSFQMKIV